MKTIEANELITTPNETVNKVPQGHMILGEGQYYDLDCYKTKRNNNVLVVGAAGTGKTRHVVIPNLLQATGSYVVSDPKGYLYQEYGQYLEEKGYDVVRLNFDNPSESIHYNFMNYIRSYQDVLKIAHMLIYSSDQYTRGSTGNDPFWDASAENLLTALIGYLWSYRPESERNLNSLQKLVEAGDFSESDPDSVSVLDRLFRAAEKNDPNGMPIRAYRRFSVAATKTKESILITLNSHIGKYCSRDVLNMTEYDETDIRSIGHRKTAFFVQVSDTDRSMDDLANLFFTQAMNELCDEANNHCKDYRLPVDVRFIMDDFATNVKISDFPRMISGIRSRGISVMLMIQAESQLKHSYGEDGETIIANCDNYVYLGTNDISSAESVAKKINKPVHSITGMPLETAWIIRRGDQPVHCRLFPLEENYSLWSYEAPKGQRVWESTSDYLERRGEDLPVLESEMEELLVELSEVLGGGEGDSIQLDFDEDLISDQQDCISFIQDATQKSNDDKWRKVRDRDLEEQKAEWERQQLEKLKNDILEEPEFTEKLMLLLNLWMECKEDASKNPDYEMLASGGETVVNLYLEGELFLSLELDKNNALKSLKSDKERGLIVSAFYYIFTSNRKVLNTILQNGSDELLTRFEAA